MRALTVTLILGLVVGCAGRRPGIAASSPEGQPRGAAPTTTPATVARTNPRAMLALDQIEPKVELPKPKPTTLPASTQPAPVEAIELYARALDARFRNQHYSAINLLEQALKFDPDSFELNAMLGGTYHRVGRLEEAIRHYRRAHEIDPDDLLLQGELGRAYMQRGDETNGLLHLRMARATGDYATEPGIAAAVDYRLAVALQQTGHDRAALQVYGELLERLQHPSSRMRGHPEIVYLLNRPEFLIEQLARLHENLGQYDAALEAYQLVAQRSPDDFNAHARVVRVLMSANKGEEAIKSAAHLVRHFRASPDALALLREAYARSGRPQAIVDELARLHEQRPQDRYILFALAESLESVGRSGDAEELLIDAAERRDGDVEIVSRLARLLIERGELERCAQVLIEASARRPHTTAELADLWMRLASPGRRDALTIRDVRELRVSPAAEAAKLFHVSRVADIWNRGSVAEIALEQAVRATPPFAPAFRARAQAIWNDPHLAAEHKRQSSESLATAAIAERDESLATEVRAIALAAQDQPQPAADAFERALPSRPNDPQLQFAQALALRAAGNAQRFEQIAWRIISDHPNFADVYSTLFRHCIDRGNLDAARHVAQTWLANAPASVDARILNATVQLRLNGQRGDAERVLTRLLEDHPDRLDVLVNLRAFFTESNDISKFVELLEQARARQPYNYPLVAMLVDVYAAQQRLTEASRAIDAARAALADDPDRSYFVAHLYQRIGQAQIAEQVLERVLALDPGFAPANNDLGYTLADSGRSLDRAEALVRRAVEAEPLNSMFLDSLGWVLYKRGRFDEARRYLEQAVANARPADAVILDHLGDAYYQLNRRADAAAQWKLAQQRIAPDEDQHNALRLTLEQKLRQAEQDQPVTVAPVIENAAAPGQAKN